MDGWRDGQVQAVGFQMGRDALESGIHTLFLITDNYGVTCTATTKEM